MTDETQTTEAPVTEVANDVAAAEVQAGTEPQPVAEPAPSVPAEPITENPTAPATDTATVPTEASSVASDATALRKDAENTAKQKINSIWQTIEDDVKWPIEKLEALIADIEKHL